METVTIMTALSCFGNIDEEVEIALREHMIRRITERITALKKERDGWERKYGTSYERYAEMTATDKATVDRLNVEHPTWEADLMNRGFCVEELTLWRKRLDDVRFLNH